MDMNVPGIMRMNRAVAALWRDLAWAIKSAADFRSWYRLSMDFLLFRVMRVFRLPSMGNDRRARLRGGVELNYRLDRSDIWTIHEIWVDEIYRLPASVTLPARLGVLVDLGANIGLATLWMATKWGAQEVIGAEPSSANARVARQNFERNGLIGDVLEVAVGGDDGKAVFMAGPGATNGRIDFNGEAQNGESTTTVDIVTMKTLLSRLPNDTPLDLVKIDIEGGEQALLTHNPEWLQRVNVLICEFHPQLVDYPALIRILEAAGLCRAAMLDVNENTVECFIRPKPVRAACATAVAAMA